MRQTRRAFLESPTAFILDASEAVPHPGPRVVRPRKHAVGVLLKKWPSRVRASWVAYVPAHQGYVVMTTCRALYSLATGGQMTKEEAAAWAAAGYPEWSSFISEAQERYRADVRDAHRALIAFTDDAVAQADDLVR